ncbi:hypothetical protein AAIO99_26615 [Streptomyces sp. AC154]
MRATVSECQPPRAPIVVHGPSAWFDQLNRIRTLEEQLLVARVVWVAQLLVLLNETHEGAFAALADPIVAEKCRPEWGRGTRRKYSACE